jgi:hypothetical protein
VVSFCTVTASLSTEVISTWWKYIPLFPDGRNGPHPIRSVGDLEVLFGGQGLIVVLRVAVRKPWPGVSQVDHLPRNILLVKDFDKVEVFILQAKHLVDMSDHIGTRDFLQRETAG